MKLLRVALAAGLAAVSVCRTTTIEAVRPAATVAGDDVLASSIKRYASLRSYADTGTVVNEFAPGSLSKHTFRTYFKAPRQFYFEFVADKSAGGRQIVIWCDGGDFQSWDSSLGSHRVYPRGSNTTLGAFAAAAAATMGSVSMIPALLFSGSGLMGTVNELKEYSLAGDEDVGGRRARKLIGVARSVYPQTQRETNVRRAAIWIDVQTGLVRQVFDDTPKGLPLTAVMRTTITYDPLADPALDDGTFRFAVPSLQK